MAAFRLWDKAAALATIDEMKGAPGAVLPILHALQEEFGFIHAEVTPMLADALNLSRAEIHGTLSFYHDFRHQLPGSQIVKLCRAEACQANGCERLVDHLQQAYGLAMDKTTADGRLTLETVYCLGNCGLGPSALIDGELIGRVDTALLDDLCDMRPNPRLPENSGREVLR